MSNTIEGEYTVEQTALATIPQGAPIVPLHFFDAPVQIQSQIIQAVAREATTQIEARKWYAMVQGKKHIEVEGWQFIAALLRCSAKVTSTAKLEDDEGYEAHAVVIRTDSGVEISAADGMCARDEKRWKTADKYAIRSMAQTRACSRAIQHAFRFIAELAGYSGTPAEEVPPEGFDRGRGASPAATTIADLKLLHDEATAKGKDVGGALGAFIMRVYPDFRPGSKLNAEQAQKVADALKQILQAPAA